MKRKIEELRAYMNPSSYGVTLRIDGKEFSGRAECGDTAQDAYREIMKALRTDYKNRRIAGLSILSHRFGLLLYG